MTTYRTKNISLLQTWLIGGQINHNGDRCEGFHSLTLNGHKNGLIENGSINRNFLINEIEASIECAEENNESLSYYGDKYKFSKPSAHNFKILVNRIEKQLKKVYELA